jgi:16S rRNA (adenine1518-N6/adenine1519-N6)-dimethyltransferase
MGRKLGQHFLVSEAILDRIVTAAALTPEERVLEVGPGRGALTEKLRAAGETVTVVELDPDLAAALRERWPDGPRFRLIEADILEAALDADALFGTAPGPDRRYAVIANLPYYLTTPLLFRFVRERRRFTRLLLMVQREVAERLAASPADGHAYGSLSIAAQVTFAVRLVLRVPPGAFHPRPKVDSAVVELRPLSPQFPPEREAGFLDHVKGLFSQRRKRMAGTLGRARPRWPEAALERALTIVGDRRPEALTPAEHLTVYGILEGESRE